MVLCYIHRMSYNQNAKNIVIILVPGYKSLKLRRVHLMGGGYICWYPGINQNLPSETGGGYISWGVHNNMLELTVIRNRFTADNNDLKLIMIDKSPHRKK